MMIVEKVDERRLWRWLLFCFFTLLIPMVSVWVAFSYLETVFYEIQMKHYQIKSLQSLEKLRVMADSNNFICSTIKSEFTESNSVKELQNRLLRLNQATGWNFKYLIWNKTGHVFASDFDYRSFNANFNTAYFTLRKASVNNLKGVSRAEVVNLRKIFGSQFFPERHTKCYNGSNLRLISGDSSGMRKLSWIMTDKRFGLMLFFDRSCLKKMTGLYLALKQGVQEPSLILNAILDKKWILPVPTELELTRQEFNNIITSYDNPLKIGNYYLFKNTITSDLLGVCYFKPHFAAGGGVRSYKRFAFVFSFLIAIIIAIRAFQIIYLKRKIEYSIQKQLIALFLLSNMILFLSVGVFAYDYIRHYKLFLQRESFDEGIKYLQSIDEMFVSEYSQQLRNLSLALPKLKESLKKNLITPDATVNFLTSQKPKPVHYFLIGSHTPFISSKYGIVKDGKYVTKYRIDSQYIPAMELLSDSVGKLGKYYLSLVNKEYISDMKVAEVEMVAEAIGDLKPIAIFQKLVSSVASIWYWGIGLELFPVYSDVFVNKKGQADYVMLYLWRSVQLQREYIASIINDLNRNPFNLKIIAIDDRFRNFYPKDSFLNKDVISFASKLMGKTGTEMEFCEYQGQEHILMGLKCENLDSLRLMALYPVDIIDRRVIEKTKVFIALILISFLTSIGLGLLASREILEPLSELHKGVIALKKQNFTYRLPNLGNDEFGELAQVFNSTLIDLEEIETASIVREKILDIMTESVSVGEFSYFGNNQALSRFPSDYFAVEIIDEQRHLIIIGDVCGLSIASNLIIAFVKSCFILLNGMLANPKQLLEKINNLFISLNAKSKNYMTMQCILIDSTKNYITVANAGHCFPIIVNHKNHKTKSVELLSYPLGASKKSNVAVSDIYLKSDEIMIFYTKGIYSSFKNGFDDLIISLENKASDFNNPQEFYKDIMTNLSGEKIIDKSLDDMTMVVINRCNFPSEETNDKAGLHV